MSRGLGDVYKRQFFFCPFHAFNRRHKILSLIFAWIHHFFFLRYVNIMFGLWGLTVKRHKKIFHLHRLICKRRKILSSYAVPLLFMNGSYTHGIRNLRISGILISSPYNGGNRLHLLLYNFRQLLKGEFHNFLPLLLSNQQFSVLRSECTIPYHCILLITLFGFFEMNIRLNHSL